MNLSELTGLFSAGSALLFGFAGQLNGDAAHLGTQVINFGASGSQLVSLGLSQVASSFPSVPSLPTLTL